MQLHLMKQMRTNQLEALLNYYSSDLSFDNYHWYLIEYSFSNYELHRNIETLMEPKEVQHERNKTHNERVFFFTIELSVY